MVHREEYRRHQRLYEQIRNEIEEREGLKLEGGLTAYQEPGYNRIPVLYGSLGFTTDDGTLVELTIWQSRATFLPQTSEPGDRKIARLDLKDGYEVGQFDAVSEVGQTNDLPAPEERTYVSAAADYILDKALSSLTE